MRLSSGKCKKASGPSRTVNVHTQAAIAGLMRVRAIDLADAGADIKSGATNTKNPAQQSINFLKRQ